MLLGNFRGLANGNVFGAEPRLIELALCLFFAVGSLLQYSERGTSIWLAAAIPISCRSLQYLSENLYSNPTPFGNLPIWLRIHIFSIALEALSIGIIAALTLSYPHFTQFTFAEWGIGSSLATCLRGVVSGLLVFYLIYRIDLLLGWTMLKPPDWPSRLLFTVAVLCALFPLFLWLNRMDVEQEAMWKTMPIPGGRWGKTALDFVPRLGMFLVLLRLIRKAESGARGQWEWRKARIRFFLIWFGLSAPELSKAIALTISSRFARGDWVLFLTLSIIFGLAVTICAFRLCFPSLIRRLNQSEDDGGLAAAVSKRVGALRM